MIMTLSMADLTHLVGNQLLHFYPDNRHVDVHRPMNRALERLEHCFSRIRLPGYRRDTAQVFNHLHSDQYAVFLYLLSNTAWEQGDVTTAEKLFCLNKALNGIVCMYDTKLPDIFILIHALGMVIGKAIYGDYLVLTHNVTIGADRGIYPTLGRGVLVFNGSSIIGSCTIGDYATISTRTLILNQSVPPSHVCAGRSPTLIAKPAKRKVILDVFDVPGLS